MKKEKIITSNILQRYYEENFFIIPIRKDDKRPKYKRWNEYSISYLEALAWIKAGGNIGVVTGKQSIKDGYELIAIDIDDRPKEFQVEYYRAFGTWIQFTPNNGFHILIRVKLHENVTKIEEFLDEWNIKPHRTTLDPKHEDNTFNTNQKIHDIYFADTIRWTSMYIVIAPSKVNGKSYWWLDDCKGEIIKL